MRLMPSLTRKHIALIVAIAVLLFGWYAYPVTTFGGVYIHVDSSAEYRFSEGRLYENGTDVGSYDVFLRTVTIKLDRSFWDEPFAAKIGFDTVDMPLPKYGPSRLVRHASS
jgi:hypothetical protein